MDQPTLEQRIATAEDTARNASMNAESAQSGVAALSLKCAELAAKVPASLDIPTNIDAAGEAVGRAYDAISNVTNPSVDAFRALTEVVRQLMNAMAILVADLGGPVHGAAAEVQSDALANALRAPDATP